MKKDQTCGDEQAAAEKPGHKEHRRMHHDVPPVENAAIHAATVAHEKGLEWTKD